jgi:hypothetical protein
MGLPETTGTIHPDYLPSTQELSAFPILQRLAEVQQENDQRGVPNHRGPTEEGYSSWASCTILFLP